jgi:glycosyltransferase involved in cell wall biosynthesis
MEAYLPFILRKIRPDLLLSAEGFCSLSSSCKQLPVIYDLNFEHDPKNLAWKNRIYFRFFFPKFCRKAIRIATISEYSKTDITQTYQINPNKIDNVSCGINPGFYPLSQAEIEKTRNEISGGKPYFFFIGSMHPRKNIHRLIEAFEIFKQKTNSDLKLVISGAIRWKTSEMKNRFENSVFKNDILFTGRVSDQQLHQYLGAAFSLAFVPIFEGFGLPRVEAFQADVPVVCSNVTSLPEVAGDAAITVNPYSPEDISEGLIRMANISANERMERIQKGRERKLLFSWKNTADLLWESVEKSIGL